MWSEKQGNKNLWDEMTSESKFPRVSRIIVHKETSSDAFKVVGVARQRKGGSR